ncbi:hypothetical protein IWY39_003726 [Sphingobium sp. JAI105]|uniref:hypothetical protein n=1 Tax=unclassified Sphingobium TaxID=2611147 RepID=UPI00119F61E6|nr:MULTISPECIES: hypothetical protein [unclassified Sphingobium]MBG6119861.1 hypothetical protein [Sphingobium sp. JAI105]
MGVKYRDSQPFNGPLDLGNIALAADNAGAVVRHLPATLHGLIIIAHEQAAVALDPLKTAHRHRVPSAWSRHRQQPEGVRYLEKE